jgi:hypothetical protein
MKSCDSCDLPPLHRIFVLRLAKTGLTNHSRGMAILHYSIVLWRVSTTILILKLKMEDFLTSHSVDL